jgi:hypothetical protein
MKHFVYLEKLLRFHLLWYILHIWNINPSPASLKTGATQKQLGKFLRLFQVINKINKQEISFLIYFE